MQSKGSGRKLVLCLESRPTLFRNHHDGWRLMSLDGARGITEDIDDPDADEFMHFESGVATASYRALIAWASQSDMLVDRV